MTHTMAVFASEFAERARGGVAGVVGAALAADDGQKRGDLGLDDGLLGGGARVGEAVALGAGEAA